MNSAAAAGLGIALVVLLLFIRWKWRSCKQSQECHRCSEVSLVHHMCPHNNVVQSYEVQQKDSLDEHLDLLTKKLAEKEGRLRLSKSKIRETQHEIESLHAIDQDVRTKYRDIMDSLRNDLMSNERECKKLQEQIEWVSRRRAELKEEVRRGQRLYGQAAAELACNLAELQRGRYVQKVTDKPRDIYTSAPRHRKEPHLPKKVTEKPREQQSVSSGHHSKEPLLPRCPLTSIVIKSPGDSPDTPLSLIDAPGHRKYE